MRVIHHVHGAAEEVSRSDLLPDGIPTHHLPAEINDVFTNTILLHLMKTHQHPAFKPPLLSEQLG